MTAAGAPRDAEGWWQWVESEYVATRSCHGDDFAYYAARRAAMQGMLSPGLERIVLRGGTSDGGGGGGGGGSDDAKKKKKKKKEKKKEEKKDEKREEKKPRGASASTAVWS